MKLNYVFFTQHYIKTFDFIRFFRSLALLDLLGDILVLPALDDVIPRLADAVVLERVSANRCDQRDDYLQRGQLCANHNDSSCR